MGILKHVPKQIGDRVPKVYFSCHKDDFKPYFKEISEEIMNGRSCAVFYDEDYDGARDKEFLFDLSKMNLFVMPITTRLLTKPNRALDEELAFALEHKIPVLPLMQEQGLEELFNKKFGDLQFLDKYNRDSTAISYDEKLKKYLSSVLLDDKTIKRIRDEFDARMFLSYRKKDRIHANRLMRLIHKNDFCRDIAIWYDEFLTPGENFNKTIAEALNKSDLFVLAVTPSLLEPRVDENGVEHKNYIEEHEYPMAVEAQKPILPTELVYTDKDALAVKYANVPDCVNADDESALTEALLNTAKKFVSDENDNSPEHNYLIGLAYLDGIDVEVDHARAREMIEYAANADYIEAIDKMIDMYSNGRGVERNYETAIQWHEKKIAFLQMRYNENPNDNNSNSLFWAIIECGDDHKALGKLSAAKEKYEQAEYHCLENDQQVDHRENAESRTNTLRILPVAYDRLGDIYQAEGDIKYAKEFRQSSFKLAETLVAEIKTVESRRALWHSIIKLSDIYAAEGKIAKATEYYEKAFEIADELAAETETMESRRDLLVSYSKLGDAHRLEGNIETAKKYYEKTLEIAEVLAAETETMESRRDLAISYGKLGDTYEAEGNKAKAKEYYEKALEIVEVLAAETETMESRRDLLVFYGRICSIYQDEGAIAKARECCKKALEIAEVLAAETETMESRRDLAISYGKLGDTYEAEGNKAKAKEYYEKALKIYKMLAVETKTPQALDSLAVMYYQISVVSYGTERRICLVKALEILNGLCNTCPEVTMYIIQRQLFEILLDTLPEDE